MKKTIKLIPATIENTKVGTEVFSTRFGNGVISHEALNYGTYVLEAIFKDADEQRVSFTKDGMFLDDDMLPSLFLGKVPKEISKVTFSYTVEIPDKVKSSRNGKNKTIQSDKKS